MFIDPTITALLAKDEEIIRQIQALGGSYHNYDVRLTNYAEDIATQWEELNTPNQLENNIRKH